jgi:hypothetical protein
MMTLKKTEQWKTPKFLRNSNRGNTQPKTPRQRILVHLLHLSSREK